MVKAGEMATGYRYTERVVPAADGVRWIGYRQCECVVLSVSLGFAHIEWCADGLRTVKRVDDLKPE